MSVTADTVLTPGVEPAQACRQPAVRKQRATPRSPPTATAALATRAAAVDDSLVGGVHRDVPAERRQALLELGRLVVDLDHPILAAVLEPTQRRAAAVAE